MNEKKINLPKGEIKIATTRKTKNNPSVKVIIAVHKKYRMPTEALYIPLHVGAEGKMDKEGKPLDLGYRRDDTGDNISSLNPSFCELTGLYCAWKNLDDDYIGVSHYRRHFSMKGNTWKFCRNRGGKSLWSRVLTYEQLRPYLGRIRVFTPNKRKYYIETLYTHYKHTHYSNQLDETRQVIVEKYPEYLEAYDRVIKHTYGYMFNMMIMEKELMNDYCSWLFDILFELGKRINEPELSSYQERFYGRISEIIFNVWLEQKLKSGVIDDDEMMEIPCIHMEKINWWKKGSAFLSAKFFGNKYTGSF